MLTVHNLSKTYGLNLILKDVSFSINPFDRVGLIGLNGCGKSTLLRLIMGEEQPDHGVITRTPTNLTIGYLSQGFEPDPHKSITTLVHEATGDIDLLEKELAELAMALGDDPENIKLQDQYDVTLDRLSQIEPAKIQSLLEAFGLHQLDPNLAIGHLSGGQKTRLSLALILMRSPQLLLLDEPTNHLDIEMLEWLESWLSQFNGGALIVSHDRTFLDKTTTRILDLNPVTHTIKEYPGNYSDYLNQFLTEQAKQWQAYKDQEYEIRKMRQDIARTREQSNSVERSTTPRQPNVRRLAKKVMKKAKSREKKLDRYLASDERVEKPKRSWQMKLDLDQSTHLGKDVLILTDLIVGYDKQAPLISNINQHVLAGQRVIITGRNGSGKTTLLRTIAGHHTPLSGYLKQGASVHLGYMSQEQELLDPQKTALETIQAVMAGNETEIRSFLHFFLFSGDDPLRPCAELSFGERARLSLALLVAQGCNCLLLDEPINHLDIPSRTKFEEALSQFQGTILAVVHDRYFIHQFASEVWTVQNEGITAELR